MSEKIEVRPGILASLDPQAAAQMQQGTYVRMMNEIAAALAKAQSEITNPPRNREVAVKTKTGGTYKFRYATLDTIIEHIRKPLTDNGLWFTQTLADGGGQYRLITRLIHSSGQFIESETPLLVDGAGNQAFGSALSYMRRYALTSLLGIAADEDDDANHADGNTITDKKERPGDGVRGAAAGPKMVNVSKDAEKPEKPMPEGVTKTALKTKSHELVREIHACEDLDSLIALQDSMEFRRPVNQMKQFYPDGFDAVIEAGKKRKGELEQTEVLGAG